jgi:hypothetical protein
MVNHNYENQYIDMVINHFYTKSNHIVIQMYRYVVKCKMEEHLLKMKLRT